MKQTREADRKERCQYYYWLNKSSSPHKKKEEKYMQGKKGLEESFSLHKTGVTECVVC
jgi:hypothetical protein